jgi:zinc transporter, ZIP family
VLEALALGALSQVSLLLSGLFATWVRVPTKVVGWLAGFGAGALISAVCFDLTEQAEALGGLGFGIWLLVGAALFIGGDMLVDRKFGGDGASGPLGIVLGSVVDGVPESLIFGIGVAAGDPVSAGFLGAVIVSNIPQALAPSADLVNAGWSRGKLSMMWGAVVLACGLAAGIGYLLGDIGGDGRRLLSARRGWPPRHADELARAVRVRAGWRADRRVDRRRFRARRDPDDRPLTDGRQLTSSGRCTGSRCARSRCQSSRPVAPRGGSASSSSAHRGASLP